PDRIAGQERGFGPFFRCTVDRFQYHVAFVGNAPFALLPPDICRDFPCTTSRTPLLPSPPRQVAVVLAWCACPAVMQKKSPPGWRRASLNPNPAMRTSPVLLITTK